MFEWLFGNRKEVEEVKEETQKAFDAVKKDIANVGRWIKHLHGKDHERHSQISEHHELISGFDARFTSIENELAEMKALVSVLQEDFSAGLFKQPSTAVYKHTAVQAVEKPVETAVYLPVEASFLGYSSSPLTQLTSMERAIVYVLLNSELKLSYEDLAVMLGKDRSTLRSQINMIRKKCGELIEEHIEKNGKKRVYIPEEIKQKLVKNAKMRGIKRILKDKKNENVGSDDK